MSSPNLEVSCIRVSDDHAVREVAVGLAVVPLFVLRDKTEAVDDDVSWNLTRCSSRRVRVENPNEQRGHTFPDLKI